MLQLHYGDTFNLVLRSIFFEQHTHATFHPLRPVYYLSNLTGRQHKRHESANREGSMHAVWRGLWTLLMSYDSQHSSLFLLVGEKTHWVLKNATHSYDVMNTTSPVTIENLPDRDFTSEQVANKLLTSSQRLLCFFTQEQQKSLAVIPCKQISTVVLQRISRTAVLQRISREILCRTPVLIYLQGITAKDFYYSYVKKHSSRWELVGSLSGDCWLPVPLSEVPGRFSQL